MKVHSLPHGCPIVPSACTEKTAFITELHLHQSHNCVDLFPDSLFITLLFLFFPSNIPYSLPQFHSKSLNQVVWFLLYSFSKLS